MTAAEVLRLVAGVAGPVLLLLFLLGLTTRPPGGGAT